MQVVARLHSDEHCTSEHCCHSLPALPLSDEIASALTLAKKVRGFITMATADVWYPRATEQDIRDKIAEVRTEMISQRGKEAHSIHRLAELIQSLKVILLRDLLSLCGDI